MPFWKFWLLVFVKIKLNLEIESVDHCDGGYVQHKVESWLFWRCEQWISFFWKVRINFEIETIDRLKLLSLSVSSFFLYWSSCSVLSFFDKEQMFVSFVEKKSYHVIWTWSILENELCVILVLSEIHQWLWGWCCAYI
jgi:hypothetical protein